MAHISGANFVWESLTTFSRPFVTVVNQHYARGEHASRDKRNAVLPAVCLAVFDVSIGIAPISLAARQAQQQEKRNVPAGHRPNEKELSRGERERA